jgi:hypothetical protein
MARKLTEIEVCSQIVAGNHDGDLDAILQAVTYRKKIMFRPGAKVRLVNTRNPEMEGQIGTVIKVNSKRISVGLGEPEGLRGAYGRKPYYPDGELLVPASMLEMAR